MWRMLQQDAPDNYVVATNETHSVKEFVELAFDHIGLNWEKYVVIDERFYRPAEVHLLQGDYGKAAKQLDWSPVMKFKDLVATMVEADMKHQQTLCKQ
jgi:GDPmannose 4,6-dehydratase